jgi:hypothetical protein
MTLLLAGDLQTFRDMDYISTVEGSWRDSESVCALADMDRHLGHLILEDHWYAYDATKSDDASKGFKCLGSFDDLTTAKLAVELAVWRGRAGQNRYIN